MTPDRPHPQLADCIDAEVGVNAWRYVMGEMSLSELRSWMYLRDAEGADSFAHNDLVGLLASDVPDDKMLGAVYLLLAGTGTVRTLS